MSAIIQLENISKSFPARRGFRDLRGKGGLGDWLRGRKEERFTALRDISLEVQPGESLGIIGRNGSGKSTLLSIIAGVTLPSSGSVRVFGRVASLLELGAGFNPVLTGRENIYLNAGLLGMRHAQVDEVYDDIVRFSGIAEFIDQPVETYSSGMYVRIGFSVAAFVNPDIFLADEVLAVGDAEFQRKCRVKIGELREQGKTIVFVSHDLGIVNTLCERVVLLDGGRMIQRDTAQKTITYYLRQVGREKGIHTLVDGAMEAIHCDGRISLFHNQNEVSAPTGFRMKLSSLGQDHYSTDAEWEVVSKSAAGCVLSGRMMRLPVRLLWELSFVRGRLTWRIAIDCERPCPINEIGAQFHLPVAYTRWFYGDLSGEFPVIEPSDMNWNVVAAPEAKADDTAALPDEDSALPPLVFHLDRHNDFFGLFWANTEYISYCRILTAQARFLDHNCTFAEGEHPLLDMSINLDVPAASVIEQVCSDRTLRDGPFSVRFEHGQLRLFWEDKALTTYLHVYASLLVEHLWNDSQSLQWRGVTAIDGGICARGESRRFPFCQEWEMRMKDGALHLCIYIECARELFVQEYHTTIVTPAIYDRWQTDHEAGTFPAYDAERSGWTHCNQSYAPGTNIRALSDSAPSITMTTDENCPAMRMTAINTSHQEHARAFQALRASDEGRLRFVAGRHIYFSGTIRVFSATSS